MLIGREYECFSMQGCFVEMRCQRIENVLQRFGNGFQSISVSLGNIADGLKHIENDLQCILKLCLKMR